MKVWTVCGKSESGDDYGPYVLDFEPDEFTKSRIAHEWDGWWDEGEPEGPGSYGSYVYLEVEETEVLSLEELVKKHL